MLLDLHTDFSGGRSGDLVFPSLEEFFSLFDPHKDFGIVNKADVFLELSCFFNDTADVGDLISGSSAFSKSSLNSWKFMVHVLLKPCLENFEHYFASMWDKCNCMVVRTFFGIVTIQYLSLVSLSIMPSESIHIIPSGKISLLFKNNNIPLCVCMCMYIHLYITSHVYTYNTVSLYIYIYIYHYIKHFTFYPFVHQRTP